MEESRPKRRKTKKSFISEVRLLREIAWWAIRNLSCYFCHVRLIPKMEADVLTYGHRQHKPFKLKLTMHHENENHSDNKDSNLKWSHSDCHKRHHIKTVHEIVKTFDVEVYDGHNHKMITVRARDHASVRRKVDRMNLAVMKVKKRKVAPC